MQDKTTLGISDTFREYIEALVEEVVINGESFDAQKKWLRKNSEAEGVSYETIESNLNDLFEAIKELEGHESKFVEHSVRALAKDSYLSEALVNKFIGNAATIRRQKEEYDKKEDDAYRKCTTIEACYDYLKAYPQGRYVQEVRNKKTQLEQEVAQNKKELIAREREAERIAKEEAERKAREKRERKAKKEADRKEKEESKEKVELLLRSSEEDWNRVSLWGNSSPLKYILLDKETKSVAIALLRDNSKPKEITIPSTFTDYYPYDIRFNVTSIYDYAFMECEWLESITIPSSVKYIGQRAFMNCRSLSKIVFQGGTILVNRDSFENTPFVNSPAYQEAIKKGNIVVASGTSMIDTPPRLHPYFTMYDKRQILPETKPPITPMDLVIPAKTGDLFIKSIRGFEECDTVRSIIFRSRPNLVIEFEAFLWCRNLESVVFEPIEHLTIRRNAFAYCGKFSSLTFESPSAHIESDAFRGCNLPLKKRMELWNMERIYAKTHWTN